jgi:hypothetical protein
VAEVTSGLECGVLLADTNYIRAGYMLAVFVVEVRERTLSGWSSRGAKRRGDPVAAPNCVASLGMTVK